MGLATCSVIVLISVLSCSCLATKNSSKTTQVHQKHFQDETHPLRYFNRRSSSDYSLVPANALPSYQLSEQIASLPEFTDFGKKEVHENVKTIIVTKKVPVPYTVHVEKKVPYPVRVSVRRPFTVYVPKPYLVELTKPYPLAIKVPVPQPYAVEKHVPFPVKIPIDKPIPIHISKPYPVIFEKKVPVPVEKHIPIQIKIPYDRPVPVHIPLEKPFLYPVEKPMPIPFRFPSAEQRPVLAHMEKLPSEHVLEKPQAADLLPANNLVNSYMERAPAQKTAASNFYPSAYDPYHSSLLAQGSNQITPSSTTMKSYSLGTIHVPETQSYNWSASYTDWVPKQRYPYKKSENSVPNTMNTFRIVLPDRLANTLNIETMAAYSDSPTLKETHGIHYEPVRYDALKQEVVKISSKNPSIQQHLQNEQLQQLQESMNNQIKSLLKGNQVSSNPQAHSEYQFYNIHPPASASQPESNHYEQMVQPDQANEKRQYHADDLAFMPTSQALYMDQPSYSASMMHHEMSQHLPEKVQLYSTNLRSQHQKEYELPQFSEPVIYGQSIEYHYDTNPMNTVATMPQTNSHAGIILPTTTMSQQTIPATSQPLQPTAPTQRHPNITEASNKNDDILNIQKHNIVNTPVSLPITFTDMPKHLFRKIRRKNGTKRKSSDRQIVHR